MLEPLVNAAMPSHAHVALIRGPDRRASAYRALDAVRAEAEPKVRSEVLIKPNFLSDSIQLASSHVDSVRGVIDFLLSVAQPPRRIVVAEGSAGSTQQAFENFGYAQLPSEYDVEIALVDLHAETRWAETTIFTEGERPTKVRMPKTVLEAPCTISLARAKTHDVCVVTLALKNMIMGTLCQPDRVLMHGFGAHPLRRQPVEAKFLNINLIRVARFLAPDLAVVDGITGLQGNGPGGRDEIDLDVVAAGVDVYAVDAVMTAVMGFDPTHMGVLHYARTYGLGCADLDRIAISGARIDEVRRRFKPHESTPLQQQWQKRNADALLAA